MWSKFILINQPASFHVLHTPALIWHVRTRQYSRVVMLSPTLLCSDTIAGFFSKEFTKLRQPVFLIVAWETKLPKNLNSLSDVNHELWEKVVRVCKFLNRLPRSFETPALLCLRIDVRSFFVLLLIIHEEQFHHQAHLNFICVDLHRISSNIRLPRGLLQKFFQSLFQYWGSECWKLPPFMSPLTVVIQIRFAACAEKPAPQKTQRHIDAPETFKFIREVYGVYIFRILNRLYFFHSCGNIFL